MKHIQKEKAKLIRIAQLKNPDSKLVPCGKRTSLDECFTVFENKILFWFNTTKNSSTQMVYVKL